MKRLRGDLAGVNGQHGGGYFRQATENLPKRIAAILARPNSAIGHPNEKAIRLLKVTSHSSGGCFEVAR